MKATGIVRQIDDLGRIVIPKELRRTLGLNEGDPMEIFVTGESVILRKYQPGCSLCGEVSETYAVMPNGKRICPECIQSIKKAPDSLPTVQEHK